MSGAVSAEHFARAKSLLREKMTSHPDRGVRLLAQVTELPNDDPAVLKIANTLAQQAPR